MRAYGFNMIQQHYASEIKIDPEPSVYSATNKEEVCSKKQFLGVLVVFSLLWLLSTAVAARFFSHTENT